jgi:protein-S-isoprenylcysteine O-methyltransferase Ste14
MLDRVVVGWIIDGLWIVWAGVWILMAFGNKRSVYRQSWMSRFAYLLLAVGFYLYLKFWFHWHVNLFSESAPTQVAGIALCAAGIALAIWSRFILGSNWSGIVALKENHELIRRGPYGYIRHPIYSGLILAIFGVMLALFPRPSAILVILFAAMMLKMKSLQEERILIAQFPDEYPRYKREVKSLIPFIL